jgi:3-deoxy-7-phosphoheptulonate synthase
MTSQRPNAASGLVSKSADNAPGAGWAASDATQDVNVASTQSLISPAQLVQELPVSDKAKKTVVESRQAIQQIVAGTDSRMLAVVGPCSIHDENAAYEFARRMAALKQRVADEIFIVMRVYFEKPRTTLGWKGLINDPHLNDSFDIETGLRLARRILSTISEMGLPTGTEMLEPITPQYIADVVSWASIGARTIESQTHRQMASGLSMPVGFKNGTDGSLQMAVDAMVASRSPHSFLGIDHEGRTALVRTKGNPHGHMILRGGRAGTNFDTASVEDAAARLAKAGLPQAIVVDCSHANSEKKFERQAIAWRSVVEQRIRFGKPLPLIGAMLESNLFEGNQSLGSNPADLKYGVSITDACLGWEVTEELILEAYEKLKAAR